MAGRGRRTTAEERERILAYYKKTQSVRETARQLGFSTETVSRLVKRAQGVPTKVGEEQTTRSAREMDREAAEAELRALAWPLAVCATDQLQRAFADLGRTKDETTQGNLVRQLQGLSVTYGILIDKAGGLSDKGKSIEDQANELLKLTRGMPPGAVLDMIRVRVRTVANAHIGLLPEAG